MTKDDFSEPPGRADSTNPIFIFCRFLDLGHLPGPGVSLGGFFGGPINCAPFLGGGPSQGALSTPPPPIESPPTPWNAGHTPWPPCVTPLLLPAAHPAVGAATATYLVLANGGQKCTVWGTGMFHPHPRRARTGTCAGDTTRPPEPRKHWQPACPPPPPPAYTHVRWNTNVCHNDNPAELPGIAADAYAYQDVHV